MKEKTATGAAKDAVSNPATETEGSKQEAEGSQDTALATVDPGEQEISLGLSPETMERLSIELQKAMHAVEMGGGLTSPTDLFAANQAFTIVDGIFIEDFVDRKTGEEKSKCLFRLEFADGRVVNTMQSAARPRKVLTDVCEIARTLGRGVRIGPYKFIKKGVGQIQDALIFEQQPGWKQEIY